MHEERHGRSLHLASPQELQAEIQRLCEVVENQKNSGKQLTKEHLKELENLLTAFSKLNFLQKNYMLAHTEQAVSSEGPNDTIRGPLAFLFMWHSLLKPITEPFILNHHNYSTKLDFLKRTLETERSK